MSKFVEGSYLSIEEAQKAIDVLISQGYSERDITLVTSRAVKDSISLDTDVEVSSSFDDKSNNMDQSRTANNEDDRSMWDKIKGAFTVDTYDETSYDSPGYSREEDVLYNYKDDIANGNILVLVDGDPNKTENNVDNLDAIGTDTTAVPPVIDPTGAASPVPPTTPVAGVDAVRDDKDLNDKEKISLQEERLDVDTNKVQTGEVNIKKNVTEETKTIEVPVEHEEVTIEKRPVSGRETTGEPLGDEEEIRIPITEEQIEVKKRPVVTDEVVIDKETKRETKEVKDTVRKEDIDVDTDGDVSVNNEDDLNKRP